MGYVHSVSCCRDAHMHIKKEHLTQKRQFEEIYSRGGAWVNRLLVMRASPNDMLYNRYGFSVSKRIGSAVIRNHVRRLIRENIRQVKIRSGWDIIFIARNPVAKSNYNTIKIAIIDLLQRANLLVEE